MASLAQLQTWLTEAEAARHALATGGQVTGVTRAGRAMRFAEMTLADLNAYIASLEQQIEAAENEAAGRPRRRAIGAVW